MLAILVSSPLFSEQIDTAWVRRYNGLGNGDDAAAKMSVDAQGNIYVAGTSSGDGTGTDYGNAKI